MKDIIHLFETTEKKLKIVYEKEDSLRETSIKDSLENKKKPSEIIKEIELTKSLANNKINIFSSEKISTKRIEEKNKRI